VFSGKPIVVVLVDTVVTVTDLGEEYSYKFRARETTSIVSRTAVATCHLITTTLFYDWFGTHIILL
jgi:hypothetical protein